MIPFTGSNNEYDSQLQRTIMSVTTGGDTVVPHHPLTCVTGKLCYDDEGTFHCEHASVPIDDIRTQQGVRHSVALLLIELAMAL